MIRLQSLTLQRGPQRLLEDAELTLHAGHKAGLIGANGAGKSTLFALLLGELTPDSGDCLLPADWRIAHMRQEIDTLDRIAIDYVLDGDLRLRQVQHDLAEAEKAQDGAAQARLHSELDSADGYTADARARKMLAGLGFTNEQMDRPVADFSGGWRMRLNLAQALMCPSDLLLLDEPTNHLDLETREALTMALAQFEGTLMLVSHDRHLLRATTDQFLIVADGKLQPFDGDLDDYRDWLFKTKLAAKNTAANAAAEVVAPLPVAKPVAVAAPAAPLANVADRREQKRVEAEERQRLATLKKPLESRIKRLDEQIAKAQAKKSAIDARLADPAIYDAGNKEELKNLITDQAYCNKEIEQLESDWLELQEQLEQLEA